MYVCFLCTCRCAFCVHVVVRTCTCIYISTVLLCIGESWSFVGVSGSERGGRSPCLSRQTLPAAFNEVNSVRVCNY